MIKESDSIYINYSVDCQKAFCYFDKILIKPQEIFLSVPIKCDENTFNIINPSNIPVNFKFESNPRDQVQYSFTPNIGKVPPNQKVQIKFEISFHESSLLNSQDYRRLVYLSN